MVVVDRAPGQRSSLPNSHQSHCDHATWAYIRAAWKLMNALCAFHVLRECIWASTHLAIGLMTRPCAGDGHSKPHSWLGFRVLGWFCWREWFRRNSWTVFRVLGTVFGNNHEFWMDPETIVLLIVVTCCVSASGYISGTRFPLLKCWNFLTNPPCGYNSTS